MPGPTFAQPDSCIMRFAAVPFAALLASSLCAQNAYLTHCFVPRYWKANTGWEIAARVRNIQSGAPLITFRVDYRHGNGPVQVGDWQTTQGINPGQYWPYVHQIPFSTAASDGELKVWVVGNGDTDHTNDTLRFPVTVLPQWSTKSVLIEQYTGTWCQFCPNPNGTTNTLDADPFIVVAKHHNSDEFSSATSTAYWAQFNANYSPSGVMEQEEFGSLPDDAAYDQWGPRAEQRKLGVSPVTVTASAAFNSWTRMLAVDVNAAFSAAVSGDFVVNAYVVEDNVPGPQTAADPGYIHHQLVREVLGGPTGTAGVIPATTVAGTTYSEQYAMQVPEAWDHGNLRIVATVSERRDNTTWTMNVTDAGLIEVGINETEALRIGAHPNPAHDQIRLHVGGDSPVDLRLHSSDGRLLLAQRFVPSNGVIVLDELQRFATGLHMIHAEQNGRRGSVRIALD